MYVDERTPGYCIIPHRRDGRVLVLSGRDGTWTLPSVRVNEEWWSPNWLGRINRQIERQLGRRVTVLRHLRAPPLWVLELECHGAGLTGLALPPRARRVSRQELGAIRLAVPELREPLEYWFAETANGQVPPHRPPWERRG